MNTFKPLVWAGTAMLVILSVFLIASTSHVLNTAATTNTVSFSGEGKVTAKPDIATLNLSINTQATTSKKAQDENSQKSKQLVDFLKKEGVDEKDIKSVSYNIYPIPAVPTPIARLPETAGYNVIQTFEVKVRDLEKASDILSGAVAAGANQVNNLQFTVEDMEKFKDEARQKAIADAKDKARALEKQINISLGKIVNFSENVGGYPYPVYYADKLEAVGRGGGGPSLPTGENEIVVQVQITYQIK